MNKLTQREGKYSTEQRAQAAVHYAVSGSLAKIECELGIPDSTVSQWKKTEWWDDIIGEVRSAKADEHRATYSQIVDLAQNKALELIPDMTDAKAALIIAATATDKVRLADNLPTTIRGDSESMKDLAAQFAQLSQQHTVIAQEHKAIKRDHENIQGSVIKDQ